MLKTQLTTDKLAIALSLACVVHCFFVPSFIILASGFLAVSIDNELVHYLILLVAAPISVFALTMGFRNHKVLSFLCIGILGLLIMISAVFFGEHFFGDFGEKSLSLLGSILVAYAHFRNHQICKHLDCSCHE